MSVKLAAQESTLPGDTLEEKFEFTLDCGFDGIELSGRGDGIFAGRAAELRRAREAGVVMCSAVMHTDVFLGDFDPDAAAERDRSAQGAAEHRGRGRRAGRGQPQRVRGVLPQAAPVHPAAQPGGLA